MTLLSTLLLKSSAGCFGLLLKSSAGCFGFLLDAASACDSEATIAMPLFLTLGGSQGAGLFAAAELTEAVPVLIEDDAASAAGSATAALPAQVGGGAGLNPSLSLL